MCLLCPPVIGPVCWTNPERGPEDLWTQLGSNWKSWSSIRGCQLIEGKRDRGTNHSSEEGWRDGSEEDKPRLKEGQMGPEGSRAEFGTIFTNTGTFCSQTHRFIWKKTSKVFRFLSQSPAYKSWIDSTKPPFSFHSHLGEPLTVTSF